MFPAKKTSICSGMSQPWGDRRVNQQYWWLFPSRKTCCFFVQAAGVKSEHRITMPFTVIKRSISVGFLASGWSLTGEFRVRHLRPTELIQRFWVAEIVHTQTRYLMRFFNADFHATCSAFTGGCARHGDVSVPTGSSAIERHTSHHPCILVKPQKPTWSAVLHWWEGQVQDGLTVFFFNKPVLQNSCRHTWKPELSKTTAITNYIYSTCFNKCPEKKGSSQCVSINKFLLLIETYMDMGQNPFLPVTVPNMNKLVWRFWA